VTGAGAPDNVVILDRDGTIVIDRGYLADPDRLEFMPGAPETLRSLYECGYHLVVITNQSGVGRGLFTIDHVEVMNARLHSMVEKAGAKLTKIYFCPHEPEAHCACRKPNLALMEQAASELQFDPRNAVVIGNKESDVEFGLRAGSTAILISSETPRTPVKSAAHLIVPTLLEAARSITARRGTLAQKALVAAS
jgi:D-glycero-D-manno-heptose 1,7-bisphosphate phosphatase